MKLLKWTMLLVFVLCLCVARDGWAKKNKYSGVLTANPIGLLFGALNASYEIPLSNQNSFSIIGSYWGFKIGDYSSSAIGAGADYRFYFEPTCPTSVYWGPTASIMIASTSYKSPLTNKTETGGGVVLYPGAEIGYQWILDNGFAIDVGGMLGVYLGSISVGGGSGGFSGVGFGVKLGLGYAFKS